MLDKINVQYHLLFVTTRIICLSYDYILDDCWIFASLPPWSPLSCSGGGGRGGGSAGDHSWHQLVTAELLRSHCWVRLLSRDTEEVLAK